MEEGKQEGNNFGFVIKPEDVEAFGKELHEEAKTFYKAYRNFKTAFYS